MYCSELPALLVAGLNTWTWEQEEGGTSGECDKEKRHTHLVTAPREDSFDHYFSPGFCVYSLHYNYKMLASTQPSQVFFT